MGWWQNAMAKMRNHFGLTGDRLNFWVMVSCSTAMLLFGYDQGVFGEHRVLCPAANIGLPPNSE